MLDIVSFDASGDFAAFRDPSVTSNQTVTYIPSKSAVIGMIGAMLGVERDHSLGEIYGPAYLGLYKKTFIGIELLSDPKKTLFFTNHRSLKESKTKPFKTEVLVSPSYRFYIRSDEEVQKRLFAALKDNDFKYAPYLGHAYCPARISNAAAQQMDSLAGLKKFVTSSVLLDESESYNAKFSVKAEPLEEGKSRMIIERHLHHFFENGSQELQRRVLRHWIPASRSQFEVQLPEKPALSSFLQSKDNGRVVCFY